ncbi:hypothetical protein T439DRAFT_174912 [Meredithblackwellia eburnea MCA 4105]
MGVMSACLRGVKVERPHAKLPSPADRVCPTINKAKYQYIPVVRLRLPYTRDLSQAYQPLIGGASRGRVVDKQVEIGGSAISRSARTSFRASPQDAPDRNPILPPIQQGTWEQRKDELSVTVGIPSLRSWAELKLFPNVCPNNQPVLASSNATRCLSLLLSKQEETVHHWRWDAQRAASF